MEDKASNITIVQLSDIHVGSQHFDPNLLNRSIQELNDLSPDLVLVTGDLTNDGFRHEYTEAKAYLDNIECENMSVIPGNHDSRNVGYVHFEDNFGPRSNVVRLSGLTLVSLDSSEPDLDVGRLGRQNYRWMVERFDRPDDLKIVALHHHLLPIPGTGRERNIIEDAGDFLELLVNQEIDLVMSGHKHVPHNWQFEKMHVMNAGTVSSLRVRGYARPCYNIIEIEDDRCRAYWKYPFGEKREVMTFPIKRKAAVSGPQQ